MGKDPNAPKKPQTAYWLWLGENREKLLKELGTRDVTAVSKLAGEKWKALDAKLKVPFEKKAKGLKEAYDKALEEYKATKRQVIDRTPVEQRARRRCHTASSWAFFESATTLPPDWDQASPSCMCAPSRQ